MGCLLGSCCVLPDAALVTSLSHPFRALRLHPLQVPGGKRSDGGDGGDRSNSEATANAANAENAAGLAVSKTCEQQGFCGLVEML